jgi:hypothetical protein
VKTIFHVDMDAFFVSVEELFDPSLKGKAVVVGGRPNERGVVSAASYEARKFGVHSAMPLRTAARMCPHAIFVDGHPTRYREYSVRVREVLNRFSPLVEMASIDEAYLDMTGTERLHGPPLAAAHALHQCMKAETRLNCSIGIATARLVAKVVSDQAKPNGVMWILPGAKPPFWRRSTCARFRASARLRNRICTSCRSVQSATWRAWTNGISKSASASGDWRWRVKRAAWMRAAGSTPKSARTPIPSRSATSTRTTKTPAIWRCSNPRWRGSPRWSAAACAKTACTRARCSSNCAIRISPPSRARIPWSAPRSSIRRSSTRRGRCS